MDSTELASKIDHTLLKPEATPDQVEAVAAEAVELAVAAVCVSPVHVRAVHAQIAGTIGLATVIGFPSGAHPSIVKATEAAQAIADGATELDMVARLGAIAAADWAIVEADIASVRDASPGVVLKVILETGLWDIDTIVRACEVAAAAGADYVKTSTGFHPTGGATLEAVAAMHGAVGGRLGVKASGGIGDRATAEAMIAAGATRIGASKSRAILGR
ncbi:MAG TPA: deoxyribose-phosphate aldolase [Acidimicrobiales bacterium]|nr:deoxyribose-phosphate aldolase [Acidimicrobiales bacterium]